MPQNRTGRSIQSENLMVVWLNTGDHIQMAACGIVSELLMQSVGGTIRVFPAWPKEKDAKFEDLRAQGGFLVGAEQKDGKVASLRIVSTVGGKLRLLDPWTGELVERETAPDEVVTLR